NKTQRGSCPNDPVAASSVGEPCGGAVVTVNDTAPVAAPVADNRPSRRVSSSIETAWLSTTRDPRPCAPPPQPKRLAADNASIPHRTSLLLQPRPSGVNNRLIAHLQALHDNSLSSRHSSSVP